MYGHLEIVYFYSITPSPYESPNIPSNLLAILGGIEG